MKQTCRCYPQPVQEIVILEVVSGLGVGGAEKALLSRLRSTPENFRTRILNTRPELDALSLNRGLDIINARVKFSLFIPGVRITLEEIAPNLVIVRTPLDAIRFSLIKHFYPTLTWKLVYEVHSNFVTSKKFLGPVLEIIFNVLKSKIDHYIAVSENVRRGPLCKSSKNSSVIYLGADSMATLEKSDHKVPPKLLFLGRLTKVKRPLILVESISKLAKEFTLTQNFLTMVGDGELKNDLDKFVLENELAGIVQVVGYKADVSHYLAECTHLVSVSSNEGLPISFFEAKLSGMRIISTPSGGGNEIFDELDFELPSFEVEDLVTHLETILHEEFSGESRKQIALKSAWMKSENCSKRYFDLLDRLVNQ